MLHFNNVDWEFGASMFRQDWRFDVFRSRVQGYVSSFLDHTYIYIYMYVYVCCIHTY